VKLSPEFERESLQWRKNKSLIMSSRSLAASESGKEEIQKALTTEGWSREDLAKKAEVTRSTVINFCTGKKVDRKNFVKFCELLKIDWQSITGSKAAIQQASESQSVEAVDLDGSSRIAVVSFYI
jgi:ribosome-binding protein aMBF1 (putative translation factor)